MKIFGKHIYFFVSNVKIGPNKIKALADGLAHIHGDPIRKPLIRIIEKKNKEVHDAKD